MLKRGISGTIEELLMCAEYIVSNGNYNVMVCERHPHLRNLHATRSTSAPCR